MLQRYFSLYGLFLIQRLKILMEYRIFFIGAISTVIIQAGSIIAVWAVMSQVPSLNGWSLDEVLLIYGFLTLSLSINHMFADNLWTLGWQHIRSGGFDRFLVRPVNPLFHLLADRFCHDGVGNFLVGLSLVIKASIGLGLTWTAWNVLYAMIAVISGGLIFVALNLITATSSFWIINSIPVTQAVHLTHETAKYPLTIYHKAIRVVMTWLLPYGLASFYPASYILGRDAGLYAFGGPVAAAGLLFVGYRFCCSGCGTMGARGRRTRLGMGTWFHSEGGSALVD